MTHRYKLLFMCCFRTCSTLLYAGRRRAFLADLETRPGQDEQVPLSIVRYLL